MSLEDLFKDYLLNRSEVVLTKVYYELVRMGYPNDLPSFPMEFINFVNERFLTLDMGTKSHFFSETVGKFTDARKTKWENESSNFALRPSYYKKHTSSLCNKNRPSKVQAEKVKKDSTLTFPVHNVCKVCLRKAKKEFYRHLEEKMENPNG